MKMYVRPQDRGQMVTVSYGYDLQGCAYKCVYDASDRSESWYRGELDWDREPEGVDQNHIPCVVGWDPCDPPMRLDVAINAVIADYIVNNPDPRPSDE